MSSAGSLAEDSSDAAVVPIEAHTMRLHERRRQHQSFDAELDEVAGFLNAQTGRLVALAQQMLDEPEMWSGVGLETPEKYLAWRVGISLGRAKRIVAMAERADELPATMAAMQAGELSEDQVWPIVKHSPAWADEQSASYAKRMTVVQLQRTVREYPFDAHGTAEEHAEADPAAADQAASVDLEASTESHAAHAADSNGSNPGSSTPGPADVCWYGETDDGRWRLHVETDLAAGSLIETVLDERRDRIFNETGEPADGVRALLALAEQSVDDAPPSRRERSRISVFIDVNDEGIADRLGRTLPDHVAAQLTCDGIVNPVLVERGIPISVGRTQRIVPERTRRIVEHRDGGCRAPGCGAQHHLEIHHIVHWGDGGPTDTWNLVCLCPHHHRTHHQGRLGISGNADEPDGLCFTDARGRAVPESGARPTPPSGAPPPISGTWEHPLGEPLRMRWLSFVRPASTTSVGRRPELPFAIARQPCCVFPRAAGRVRTACRSPVLSAGRASSRRRRHLASPRCWFRRRPPPTGWR